MVDYKPLRRVPGTRKEHDRCVGSVCQECTVGCGLLAYVRDERIVDVAGDEAHPVSRGRLCAKGIAFVQGLISPDRITLPGTRNRLQGPFEAFDNWEKGLDLLAERLRRVKDQHGPESLVIGCDPSAGDDFLLGARRFAALWGTPHVYHPFDEVPREAFPVTAPTVSCTDFPKAKCLILVEADLASTHPVAFGWVMEARKNGTKIIAADTRFTMTMAKADIALQIAPESGNLLGVFLMKGLLGEGLVDAEAMDANLEDLEAWKSGFEKLSMEDVAAATGLGADRITETVRAMSGSTPGTIITGKRLCHQEHYGIWLSMASAMGWIGREGGGWYPLESGTPPLLPEADISEEDIKKFLPREFAYPYQGGKFLADEHGRNFKALIGSGNCLNDFLSPFKNAVKDMDLAVYFGAFPNETRAMAHMVFPSTLWPERYGVSFNNDRMVQWCEKIVAPSDACRTGLGFWARLAQRLGWEAYFPWRKANDLADHGAFYDWLLEKSPETRGCTVELLKENPGGIQWPREMALLNDSAPYFKTESGKIAPAPAPESVAAPVDDETAKAFPLFYQATRISSRFSDPSHWCPWTQEHHDDGAVQIHPDTARVLGIENGDDIILAANGQIIEGHAMISRMVNRKMVWSTRRIGEKRVLVYKKGQDDQEALTILREYLQ